MLPYDSTDQVTSGVLVDAIACGRPVVATAFPHAVELLGSGAGIVVDHDDPDALASALRRVLTQPRLAGSMAAEARRLAPEMAWPVVAERVSAAGGPAPRRAAGAGMTAARHLPSSTICCDMTDRRGTFEHAMFAEPRPEHGYCTDDMARVLVVATREPDADGEVNGLAGLAVRFLNEAQASRRLPQPDGQHRPLDRRADHGGLLGQVHLGARNRRCAQ